MSVKLRSKRNYTIFWLYFLRELVNLNPPLRCMIIINNHIRVAWTAEVFMQTHRLCVRLVFISWGAALIVVTATNVLYCWGFLSNMHNVKTRCRYLLLITAPLLRPYPPNILRVLFCADNKMFKETLGIVVKRSRN